MSRQTRQNTRKTQDFFKQPTLLEHSQSIEYSSLSNHEKLPPRKKDRLQAKRKTKEELAEKTQAENSSSELNQAVKSDEDNENGFHSTEPHYSHHQFEPECEPKAIQLEKALRKPNCVKVYNKNLIKGYSGHSSVIFKRPILEGSYYFQVKILPTDTSAPKMIYQPSVRIGLCPYNYSPTIPLGGKGSFCYRSQDGMKIHMKKGQKFGPSFGVGDTIGVEVEIAPPHKYPHPEQRNEGSRVIFYKNDEKVGEYKDLKQIFYSVGVSLFNYAKVELRTQADEFMYKREGFQPLCQNLSREIPYKDLKNSRIFNQ